MCVQVFVRHVGVEGCVMYIHALTSEQDCVRV